MKKIILMRHANAHKSSAVSDFNAEISVMGNSQACSAGDFIQHWKIDKVLVSPAKRAVDSLAVMLEYNDIEDIETVRDLYESSSVRILEIIKEQANNIDNLMIVGHNPTIYQLALELVDNNSSRYSTLEESGMPTAQIVAIEFNTLNNWHDIKINTGTVTHIFNPNVD